MNETLLVVDDEEGIRNVLSISLADAGYSVMTASGVDAALALFADRRPDIILTDIKMPGRTGLELLREVKERDSDVEVIMLTGHGDLDLAIQSLKLDATDFLAKPVNDDILYHALSRASERIRMRRELRDYAANLEDNLSQLGLLLGSTAHAIKGLLTALDGSIYRMGSGLKQNNSARVEDAYRDMRLLVEKMRKMVLDILYYSKNRDLAWQEVPLAVFAEETAALVEGKAVELGVALVRDFAPGTEDAVFEADADAVSSALVNILENAVEACVACSHSRTEEGRVVFSVRHDASHVRFIVKDNGPGMNHETKEKLFTLFFSSKGSAGTGIGLYVAGQVVRQHGGTIDVSSEPGLGAMFTLTLPKKLPDAVRNAPAPEEEKQGKAE